MKVRHQPHHAPRFLTLQPEAERVTTLRVPGYRQARSYTCGFASTLMVLRYFGAAVPALELFRQLGTGRDGTRQSAIVRELRAAGLSARVRYDVDFARICREIDRNKPIIGYLAEEEHWLVIYGYGRDPDRVYVADPRPDEACCHEWSTYGARLGGFGIICSQPGLASAVRQTPLSLLDVGEPRPALPRAQPAHRGYGPLSGRLRCEVSGVIVAPPAPPAQLALPFA